MREALAISDDKVLNVILDLLSDSNYKSISCLFFPVTDEKCEKRASELWTQKNKDLIRKIDDKPRLLDIAFNLK